MGATQRGKDEVELFKGYDSPVQRNKGRIHPAWTEPDFKPAALTQVFQQRPAKRLAGLQSDGWQVHPFIPR
ncbi:hypothetical protein Ddc_14184 [Ditylenchus destructor]|nr:hypothetical protein Ddc_14184 [Ditylenchus destructor]